MSVRSCGRASARGIGLALWRSPCAEVTRGVVSQATRAGATWSPGVAPAVRNGIQSGTSMDWPDTFRARVATVAFGLKRMLPPGLTNSARSMSSASVLTTTEFPWVIFTDPLPRRILSWRARRAQIRALAVPVAVIPAETARGTAQSCPRMVKAPSRTPKKMRGRPPSLPCQHSVTTSTSSATSRSRPQYAYPRDLPEQTKALVDYALGNARSSADPGIVSDVRPPRGGMPPLLEVGRVSGNPDLRFGRQDRAAVVGPREWT